MIGPGNDLRHALRLLRQQPGFTAVALLTLALGIGATTAIFSVVNAIVLRPLPFAESVRLVRLFENNPQKGWDTFSVAPAHFVDWARESRTFESMTAFMPGTSAIVAEEEVEEVRSTRASSELFTVLRGSPALGRTFRPGDDEPGAEAVAVISHGLWRRRFGGASNIVGRVVTIDDRPTTIVGVMREEFSEGDPDTDLWVPLTIDRQRAERGGRTLAVLGRLAQTVTIEQARSEMQILSKRLARSSVIIAEGYVMAPGESVISPNNLRVTPGYFEALGVSLQRGRFFTESDTADAPRVIIIDERLAKKFWPRVDPIGRRMYQPERPDEVLKPGPDTQWLTVVGVVGAVKQQELVEGEQARLGAYYRPYAQSPIGYLGVVIKTTADPIEVTGAVRKAIAGLDPELLFGDVMAMPERVERSLQSRRTPMLLSLGFGAIALFLASIGIYGVLAYQVSQRTREIGIRMALGSDATSILRLILREGAALVLIGLAAGVAGAIVLRQVIASQLYGVGALDPVVLVSVGVVLTLAAFLACLAPARRAARVDPVVALAQR